MSNHSFMSIAGKSSFFKDESLAKLIKGNTMYLISYYLQLAMKMHTLTDIVRKAIELYLNQKGHLNKQPSLYDLSKDLCGAIKGDEDLSTNNSHIEIFQVDVKSSWR